MIVINRMFNGEYLTNNLGHEIINLFRSDNGNCYLYLNHNGRFHLKHRGKIKKMLFVRWLKGQNMIEVIGKAEGLEDVYPNMQNQELQHQYIINNSVMYGGKLLYDIFKQNVSQQDIFITFTAKHVFLAKRKIYITQSNVENAFSDNDESIMIKTKGKLAKTSLKQYYSEEDVDYSTLDELFDDPTLWKETEVKKVDKTALNTATSSTRKDTMFDVCGIIDYELAWSNAFAYFMRKYPAIVTGFSQHVLGNKKSISTPFTVTREIDDNIDLYLEDDKNIVVIENKINSAINGILKKHGRPMSESQLSKYYKYATKQANGKKDVRCYLLVPDYNKINLKKYIDGDKYTVIKYSQVYDFLKNKVTALNDAHFAEFIEAMSTHISPIKEDLFEVMKRRFVDAII